MKILIVISLLVLILLTACRSAVTEHIVIINDTSFTPEEIRINSGDSVTWVNEGTDLHTVTSWYSWTDENLVQFTIVGEMWDSGDIGPGESYTLTFESVGSYDYVTLPLFHYEYFDPSFMGVVVVE